MAQPKYEYWLTEEGLIRIWGWAIQGLDDTQVSHNIGISRSTLCLWKKAYPTLSDTLRKSKEIVDLEIVNALHSKAKAGDTTAMIFWLKNRLFKEWRDRIENTIVTPEPIKIQMDYSKLSTDELKALLHLAEKAKIE